jgi:hypothetical protein
MVFRAALHRAVVDRTVENVTTIRGRGIDRDIASRAILTAQADRKAVGFSSGKNGRSEVAKFKARKQKIVNRTALELLPRVAQKIERCFVGFEDHAPRGQLPKHTRQGIPEPLDFAVCSPIGRNKALRLRAFLVNRRSGKGVTQTGDQFLLHAGKLREDPKFFELRVNRKQSPAGKQAFFCFGKLLRKSNNSRFLVILFIGR